MTREESIRRLDEQTFKELAKEPCDDCISRQEAIDSLGECPMVWTDSDEEITAERDWKDTVKMLKSIPSVMPTQKWVPVSERLPEEEGDYLLWGKVCEDEEEYRFIGSYDSGCEQFGVWQEQFDRNTLGCLGSEFFEYASVVAWMHLPQPYKESEYEK